MDWLTGVDFVTRDCCVQPGREWGAWQYVAQLADLAIAIVYAGIAWRLWKIRAWAQKRLTKLFLVSFALFIFFCGVGHATDVLVWAWPAYKLFTCIDAITAAVSFAALITLPITEFGMKSGGA